MAATGIGNMTIDVFFLSLILGLNTALQTFISLEFGANDLHKCGVFLNRGRFVCIIAFVPLSALLLNSEKILLAIG